MPQADPGEMDEVAHLLTRIVTSTFEESRKMSLGHSGFHRSERSNFPPGLSRMRRPDCPNRLSHILLLAGRSLF
jgi:hypothetical protein